MDHPSLLARLSTLLACFLVFDLLILTIWGLVVAFGMGPHTSSPIGFIGIAAGLGGFVWIFRWARRNRGLLVSPSQAGGGVLLAYLVAEVVYLSLVVSYPEPWTGIGIGVAAALLMRLLDWRQSDELAAHWPRT